MKTIQPEDRIVMYGTEWCGDCHRAKAFFNAQGIDYKWINIEEHPETVEMIAQLNGGMRRVPTIIYPDGSVQIEPSTAELVQKHQQRSA